MSTLTYILCFATLIIANCTNITFDNQSALSFTSENGVLNLNGARFNMKGVSWFGFETHIHVVQGLWLHDYHTLISFMADHSFNALRLPFSCEMVLYDPMPLTITYKHINKDLQGLTSIQVMDKIIKACGDMGILVMLDMHSLEADGYMNNGLWYNSKYPQSTTLKVWDIMVDRYKHYWNVFAIDVFNEPFDATWGTGDPYSDLNLWCETVGNNILQSTEWLIFCEGVATWSAWCTDPCFWGENLQNVRTNPVVLNKANKIVYSPHVDGPSVSHQPYFNVPDFPNNMPAIWNQHWAFIRNENKAAVVIGEWGGEYDEYDEVWMDAFVQYLIDINATDTFFWCLNPDSEDTGGLLEYDWETPIVEKLELLETLQPNPTKFNTIKWDNNNNAIPSTYEGIGELFWIIGLPIAGFSLCVCLSYSINKCCCGKKK